MAAHFTPDQLDKLNPITIELSETPSNLGLLAKSLEFISRPEASGEERGRLAEWSQMPLPEFDRAIINLHQMVVARIGETAAVDLPESNDAEGAAEICHDPDKLLAAIEYVVTATPPHRNRWELSESLGISAQAGDQIAKYLLDRRVFKIVDYDNLAQLELNKDIASYNKIFELLENSGHKRDIYVNRIDFIFKDILALVKNRDISEKVAKLDDKGIDLLAHYLDALIAENNEPPQVAPEPYVSKEESGDIVEFLNRVYGPYMDGISFGRKELADLDPKAHRALGSYETRIRKVPLSELNLPTRSQKLDNMTAGFSERQLVAATTVSRSRRNREPI